MFKVFYLKPLMFSFMCQNTSVYVSEHQCLCVRTPVFMCQNTCVYVSEHLCLCVRTPVFMCQNTCVFARGVLVSFTSLLFVVIVFYTSFMD